MDKVLGGKMMEGINKQVEEAIIWFFDNNKMRVRNELLEILDFSECVVSSLLLRRDFHELYDEDIMYDDKSDTLYREPSVLFYEQMKMGVASELVQEVLNHRFRLKTMMTLQSIYKRYSKKFEQLQVMEHGAGTGWVTFPLAKMGATVTVFECGNMKKVIEERRKDFELSRKVRVLNPYRTAIPWNKSFDIVISYEVMEHIHDPLSTIIMFNRTLKMHGLLYLSYSFGPSPCSQHLEENYQYHGNFHNLVSRLGFSKKLEAEGIEKEFPVHIFRKVEEI